MSTDAKVILAAVVAVVAVILLFGLIAYSDHKHGEQKIACVEKGGQLVEISRTPVCAKVEILK